jgi:hypothetical protein
MSNTRSSQRPAAARSALETVAADITQRVCEARDKIDSLQKARAALAALMEEREKNDALYGTPYPAEAREVDEAELARRDTELENQLQIAGVLQLEMRRLERELSLVKLGEHVDELEKINGQIGPLGIDLIQTWNHALDVIDRLVNLNEEHQQMVSRHRQDAEGFEREYGEPCDVLPGGMIPQQAVLAFDILDFWSRAREMFKGTRGPESANEWTLSLDDYPLVKQFASQAAPTSAKPKPKPKPGVAQEAAQVEEQLDEACETGPGSEGSEES